MCIPGDAATISNPLLSAGILDCTSTAGAVSQAGQLLDIKHAASIATVAEPDRWVLLGQVMLDWAIRTSG